MRALTRFLGLFLVGAAAAPAATFTVTNSGDGGAGSFRRPLNPNTRGPMAVFIVKTFDLH